MISFGAILAAGGAFLFKSKKQAQLDKLNDEFSKVDRLNQSVESQISAVKRDISLIERVNSVEYTDADVKNLTKEKVSLLSDIQKLEAIVAKLKPAFDKKRAIEEATRRKKRQKEEEERRRRRRRNSSYAAGGYSSSSSSGYSSGGSSWGGGGGGFSGGGSSGSW